MSTFNVNINSDDVVKQHNEIIESSQKQKSKTNFDTKNYLQARLEEGVKEKNLTIRLLPFTPEGGSPFKKVWIHSIRVNKEVASSGWKMMPCLEKNAEDDTACECPICKVSRHAQELQRAANNEAQKKKLGEVAFANKPKQAWVVRCIDRDHEEDGVKFWLFNSSSKQQGIYDHMMNLYDIRNKSGKKKGNDYNIFDLNNGEDFIITITRGDDGKTIYKVVDEGMPSPLTDDFEKGMSWINDQKKWTDVFPPKSPDYMRILVEGGVPYFDKDKQQYVDKYVKERLDEEKKTQYENSNLTADTSSKFENMPSASSTEDLTDNSTNVNVETDIPSGIITEDEDIDLPF